MATPNQGTNRKQPRGRHQPRPAAGAMPRRPRRPSTAPFWVAFAASLVWIAAMAMTYLPALMKLGDPFSAAALPTLANAAMSLLLPLALIWVTAYFLWRAQALSNMAQALAQTTARLMNPQREMEGFAAVGQRLNDEIALLHAAIEQSAQRAEQLEQVVNGHIHAIDQTWRANEQRIAMLLKQLQEQKAGVAALGQTISADAAPVIDGIANAVQQLDQLVRATAATLERLDGGLKSTAGALATTLNDVATRTEQGAGQLGRQVAQLQQVTAQMDEKTRSVVDAIAAQVRALQESHADLDHKAVAFSQHVGKMQETLTTTLQGATAQLGQANAEAARAITAVGENLAGHLQQSTAQAASVLQGAGDEMSGRLQELTRDLSARIGAATEQATQSIAGDFDRAAERLAGDIDATSTSVAQKLTSAADTIAAMLKENAGGMEKMLEDSAATVFSRVTEATAQMTDHLKASTTELAAQARTITGDLDRRLAENTDAMTVKLRDATRDYTEKVETVAGAVTGRLQQTATELTGRLEDTTTTLSAHLHDFSGKMFGQLEDTSTEIIGKLDAAGAAMRDHLEETQALLFSRIESAAGDITARYEAASRLFAESAATLAVKLDETSGGFADTLNDISARLLTNLDDAGKTFDERLQTSASGLLGRIGDATDTIAGALDEKTAAAAARFEAGAGQVIEKLDATNQALHEQGTRLNGKLEDSLVRFTGQMARAGEETVGRLIATAEQLDEKLHGTTIKLTGKLQSTAQQVADTLKDISGVIGDATAHLDAEIEEVLKHRGSLFNEVIDELTTRAADVDVLMKTYVSSLTSSLDETQQRAEQLARLVVEQAEAGGETLRREIAHLEKLADEHVARAARTIREQHDKLLLTLRDTLGGSSRDFTAIVEELHRTAQQVIREVQAVRGELKTALVELPEETRDNADRMRRVVADQIAALNALAEVVKKQAASMELAGPGIFLEQADGARHTPPADEEHVSAAAMSTLAGIATGTQKRRPKAAAKSGALSPRHKRTLRETEELVAQVNAASRDLVHVLDGDLPQEQEDRWQLGEAAVYTNHLYKQRGQHMTDEISRRYAQEALVREKVDAYLHAFEKLLDTVAQSPGGDDLVNSCLASESGKVYMELATATGRIGNA
ncbi:MAG TPA: hypothetical protein ENK15_08800 [Thermopetrobacter sp.]|nr:hypothetical protein [Thermopetrobacter sp.]